MKIIKPKSIFYLAVLAGVYLFQGAQVGAQSKEEYLLLRVEPAYFSPNEDGINDQTFFSPLLQSETDITRWRLDVKTLGGKKIKRMTGAGFSALIPWDGADKKGNLLEDGEYRADMTVWGKGLKLSSSHSKTIIDTSEPLIELSVSTTVLNQNVAGQEVLDFTVDIVDESPIDRWQFQVLDMTGRTVKIKWATGTITELMWDGVDGTTGVMVPKGNYRCVFQAWDMAGNESDPVFLDVEIHVTAREMLEQALRRISVVETDLGLVVQLESSILFNDKNRKPTLTAQGEELLKEVDLLVNAYPNAQVRLDGYSRKLQGAQKNRDRSSLYAWSVYSHLVKKGNVKASRLSVRGRGRSALFERRSVNLPVTRNGVEILLVGNGNW